MKRAKILEPEAVTPGVSVGVVICAYSDARWTELVRAVDSVRAQSEPASKIVVVIDHNDALLDRARSELAHVLVVASDGPPGLAGARNTGLHHLDTDVVAFLDDDAYAETGWVAALSAVFRTADVVGVGGWVEPQFETPAPRWLAPELYWITGCSYRGLPESGRPLRNPIGANMAFRRAALLALGGFASDIGQRPGTELRDDDTDLGIRLHALFPNGRLLHVAQARVRHSVPAARTSWSYLVRRCWGEGQAKAQLATKFGNQSALAAERSYVARALPVGALNGLRDALGGDRNGLARAASIVVALAVTAAGYVFGRAVSRRPAR